jgi:regulator of sigma E protease
VLVGAHEYGHHGVARPCCIKVPRFSISFGSPFVRPVGKRRGTVWSIPSLPLGGYVKMPPLPISP